MTPVACTAALILDADRAFAARELGMLLTGALVAQGFAPDRPAEPAICGVRCEAPDFVAMLAPERWDGGMRLSLTLRARDGDVTGPQLQARLAMLSYRLLQALPQAGALAWLDGDVVLPRAAFLATLGDLLDDQPPRVVPRRVRQRADAGPAARPARPAVQVVNLDDRRTALRPALVETEPRARLGSVALRRASLALALAGLFLALDASDTMAQVLALF
ncbi:hypothetical protein [Roseivivax isoporae]|uniref:Uncharacterized protein n=1 Tax=Roseivivax isoporae LMG 25204 TaxID=1449351 RepID=X7FDF8_9RHOB|nr:hypothetical protein [Roseivivax isoporae]ETX30798.1 hypothetical protein RISW2_07565 [Roseivivax isoporae LMG 25204]